MTPTYLHSFILFSISLKLNEKDSISQGFCLNDHNHMYSFSFRNRHTYLFLKTIISLSFSLNYYNK